MPIKSENKHRYPKRKQWLEIREVILQRAKNRCEFCGVENHSVRNHARIVLSVAHLDQMPDNNDPQNLKALCQKCHINHDRPFQKIHLRITFFYSGTFF